MTRLDDLPGMSDFSFGYHSDSGQVYPLSSSEMNSNRHGYEVAYLEGDTVGCGYDSKEKTLFFTLNGTYLGTTGSLIFSSFFLPRTVSNTQRALKIN